MIIAGAVTAGLVIGCLITRAWHKLKEKREAKKSKVQRLHEREWAPS